MPRGTRDYANVYSPGTVSNLSDLAELAARLGSIDLFDRRGNVVWWDDFEGPLLQWYTQAAGTGAAVYLYPGYARMGTQCVYLKSGSSASSWAVITRIMPIPSLSKYGFETAFNIGSNVQDFIWQLSYYDGTNMHRWEVKYDHVAGTLSYKNAAQGWTVFASPGSLSEYPALFHIMKLVADFNTLEYVRVVLNETEYDLSGCTGYIQDTTVRPRIIVTVYLYGLAGLNGDGYIDSAIITQNEP